MSKVTRLVPKVDLTTLLPPESQEDAVRKISSAIRTIEVLELKLREKLETAKMGLLRYQDLQDLKKLGNYMQ